MGSEISKIESEITKSSQIQKKNNYQQIENSFQIDTPIYINVGLEDKVVSNTNARKIFDLLPESTQKKFCELPDVEHDTFSNNLVYKEVCLNAHLWFQ